MEYNSRSLRVRFASRTRRILSKGALYTALYTRRDDLLSRHRGRFADQSCRIIFQGSRYSLYADASPFSSVSRLFFFFF